MIQTKRDLLRELQRHLRYGDKREIAKRTGFTEVYVSMCLNPQNSAYNDEIVEMALSIIEARKVKLTMKLGIIRSHSTAKASHLDGHEPSKKNAA